MYKIANYTTGEIMESEQKTGELLRNASRWMENGDNVVMGYSDSEIWKDLGKIYGGNK